MTRPFAEMRRVSLILLAITVVTALSGLLREVVVAAVFGAGTGMDAFFTAHILVQTCSDLLFGGALAASVVPILTPLADGAAATRERRARKVTALTMATLGLAGLVAGLLTLSSPLVMRLLVPGLAPEGFGLAVTYGRQLAWLLPLNALVLLFTLVLNAHRRMVLAATAYLVNNLGFVAIVAIAGKAWGGEALVAAVFAGPLVMVGLLASVLVKMELIFTEGLRWETQYLAPFYRLAKPLILSLGIGSSTGLLMTAHLVLRSYGSGHGEGAVSALSYAFRIYEVPLSLIANTAATLILPAVASLHGAGNTAGIAALCRRTILWGAAMMFPAAAVTWMEADFVVDLLLRRGSFSAADAALTAEALRGFAPAVMLEASFVVFFRVLYAMRRPTSTVVVSVLTLAALVALLEASRLAAGFRAVPLALSGAFAVAALAVGIVLRSLLGGRALPPAGPVARWLVAAALSLGCWQFAKLQLTYSGWLASLSGVAGFLAGYGFLLWFLLPDYRKDLYDIIKRRHT